jgi:hypothetical protein
VRRHLAVWTATVSLAAIAAASAAGCAPSPAAPSEPDTGPVTISTKTPPGLRAKQTMDMLNSDWPIGPVGVATLAAPDKVDQVVTTMESLWWDRPFRLDGVDIRAGTATLHLTSSYGARQDIRIHTDDGGWVDRFDLDTRAPTVKSWQDIDAVLSKTGARYSYQVAKVDDGHCNPVATGASLLEFEVVLDVAANKQAG